MIREETVQIASIIHMIEGVVSTSLLYLVIMSVVTNAKHLDHHTPWLKKREGKMAYSGHHGRDESHKGHPARDRLLFTLLG